MDSDFHDRFLILDGQTLYHIGASLKDLGKKYFAFSRMDSLAPPILAAGLIESTIPEKPISRLQKYSLTDQGRAQVAKF